MKRNAKVSIDSLYEDNIDAYKIEEEIQKQCFEEIANFKEFYEVDTNGGIHQNDPSNLFYEFD